MKSSQLQDYSKNYINICNSLGSKFLEDYDKYSIIFEYKAITGKSPKYLLSKIEQEQPNYILTDERLFEYLSSDDSINISSIDTAASKGYWCSLNGIRFFFCNRFFQSEVTKILIYKRSEKNSCSMKIHLA